MIRKTILGTSDIFVARYDQSGDLVWAGQAGGTEQDQGLDIARDGVGAIYVTGRFTDKATFGLGESKETVLTSPGRDRDMFVAKYEEVVFSGPLLVIVPNVVGNSLSKARAAIIEARLLVGNETKASSESVPAGVMISQNPVGGAEGAEATTVDLVISSGPPPLTVPVVLGLSRGEAEAAIVGSGFVMGVVTTVWSESVPNGKIVSQNPPAETKIGPGSPCGTCRFERTIAQERSSSTTASLGETRGGSGLGHKQWHCSGQVGQCLFDGKY